MINLSKFIEATNLSPTASVSDIKKLCQEAKKYSVKSVCVNPVFVSIAKEFLKDSDVLVCTVVGFPLGATTPEMKAFEAAEAVKLGADEIDMVLNFSAVKRGDCKCVEEEIETVKKAINCPLKIIIETAILNEYEIDGLTKVIISTGADFIKTSTGYSTRGASVKDIELIAAAKAELNSSIGIKASGGIKTKEFAQELIAKGATRLGISAFTEILKED